MPVKLPYDMEEEILSRLPCKSLGKFRCVCKSWNSLLLEDRFVRNYFYRMSIDGAQHRFLLYGCKHCVGPILKIESTISSIGTEEQQNVVHDLTLRNVRRGPTIPMHKMVHCDGLLLCVMENQLLAWNPLLKETRWVKCGGDFHKADDAYSLGYISPCDYRILRFRCAINSRSRPPRVEVYEFASKTWKVINIISFDWYLRVPFCMVSLRGTPYWIGLRHDHHTAFVQSFDFSKERFQPLDPLPFKYVESNTIALEILQGDRLSVLEQCHETKKICIWVNFPVPSVWTKLMVVSIPLCPLLDPLATTYFVDKNCRLVINSNHVYQGTVYKIISDKDFQTIETHVEKFHTAFACRYVPSLFRIPGFSKQDTSRIRWRKNRFN